MFTNLSTVPVLVSTLLAVGYFVYRSALPRPIPGIPYVRQSANKLFGDVPDVLRWQKETQETMSFLPKKCVELQSPIIQLFMRPFARPWVILIDCQEAFDIMVRRTREFDRSTYFSDIFRATLPNCQIVMPTGEQWRLNRRLVADTMSPNFLHKVAGVRIYESLENLIKLWDLKTDLACERDIEIGGDILGATLDAIVATTFGWSSAGAMKAQIDLLSKLELPGAPDVATEIPQASIPDRLEALRVISDSSNIAVRSPLGYYHHLFATRFYPYLRRAISIKDSMFNTNLAAAGERFLQLEKQSGEDVECALDFVVQREAAAARKQSREPKFDSPILRDELMGFVTAGHETSATTVTWGFKYLTSHQEVQRKLRDALLVAFEDARQAGRIPSAEEIAVSSVPYLDACIEEMLRCALAVSMNMRIALTDTEIFGYHIPKGTNVFMPMRGPSFTCAALPVDQSVRNSTSQRTWDNGWNSSELEQFKPERWLRPSDAGDLEFDRKAGPRQAFGAGPRSCFGQKLALLSLRTIVTLVLWNFKLMPTAVENSSFAAKDVLTRQPQQAYLRLQRA